MLIKLIRRVKAANYTEGELQVNGVFFCHVVEDAVRAAPGAWKASSKIFGQTAIPYGTYPVLVTWSNRFKRQLTGVFNVPDFTGIRIHNGTTHLSSHGCPIISYTRGKAAGTLVNDRKAMNDLCKLVQQAQKKGKVVLEIVDGN
jgi:hypothetical protein